MEKIQVTHPSRTLLEVAGICLGSLMVAAGFVLFINPYKLVPGGVFGLSIVLHQLFPAVQVGTFGYILAVPILLASAFCLGKKVGFRTLLASFATPFFMNLLSSLCYPDEASLRALDPSKLLGGRIDLSSDLLLAVLFGPLLIGLGTALIIRCKASSGGSDVVAMIISRYARVRFSNALLGVDGAIVLAGMLVIGLKLSGYSLLCIFMITRILSFAISGSKNDKILFIVIPKGLTGLREFVLRELDRTATCLPIRGLYSGDDKEMWMLVLHEREVNHVTTRIRLFCPDVFLVVTDAYDTYGERWNRLPDEGDLILK